MSDQPGYQRHPLDIGPLVFGLVFLGIVAAWGLFELGLVNGADTGWILPVVLIGAGALGVFLALTKPRRSEARQAAAATYASQWAAHPERTGAYAETSDVSLPGLHAGPPPPRVGDDTLDQTTTTDFRNEGTDAQTDPLADTHADTHADTRADTHADTRADTDTRADRPTESFETDTQEHRDD